MAETTALPTTRTPWAWAIGTFFGIGFLRPGSGTWASAATLLLWYFGASFIAVEHQIYAAIAASLLAIVLGIPAAQRVARESGQLDPGKVVIDEVAGQMIAVIAAPLHWKYLILGFILFRGFDIAKPPPLRRLEKLHGGAGIMMDDVAAGLYSLLVLQIVLRFGLL